MKKRMTVTLVLLLLLLAGCRMSGNRDIRYLELDAEEKAVADAAGARVERYQLSEGDYFVEVKYYEHSGGDLWTETILSLSASAAGEEGLPLFVSWTQEPGSGSASPVAWAISTGDQKVSSGYYPEKLPEGLSAQMTYTRRENFDLEPGMEAVLALAAAGYAGKEMPSWEALDWGGMSEAERAETLEPYGAVWLATVRRSAAEE